MQRVKELEKNNDSLQSENCTLRAKLSKAMHEVDKTIEKINKVLGKLPEEMVSRFVKEWKSTGTEQEVGALIMGAFKKRPG